MGGVLYSLIGITFPWYYHIGTLVVSQSVKQCITVDLFPHILANWHSEGAPFVAYTIVEQNTQVILFENVCKTLKTAAYTLYICISDKTNMPCLSAWLNTRAIRSMKVTGKAIMLCSYGININVMCSTTLSVLVEILSGIDSDHGTGPRRNGSVNTRSTLCPIERQSCLLKTLL